MESVKEYSLRLELLKLISIPILLAGILVGSVAMWSAYHEISEVYDAQLSHAAKVLLQLTEHEVKEHESYEIELGAERPDFSHRYEKNISFRIWKGDHLVTESISASHFKNNKAKPGFSDQNIDGKLWRFFMFNDLKTGVSVEVAEKYEIRTELIIQILEGLFAPALIFIPLLLLLIWFGTTRGFKPLLNVSEAVDSKDVNDLTFIDAPRVPKEISPLIRAINRLLERLDKSLKREREFTDNAAHELQTPLAAMKTQTQVLIKKMKDASECKEDLDNLNASIDRSSRMVTQLLNFSRLQRRDLELNDTNLSSLIGVIVEELKPISINKHQQFNANISDNIVINGNVEALSIMIKNLIDNAIKYTPENGKIDVSLTENGVFSLVDTGPGIPDKDKEKVLERFKRGSTNVEGTGLGLAMVKWASSLHGAELNMNDNVPNGLSVSVKFLPRQ